MAELEVPETCLWVIDAVKKRMDPEPVRCRPDGRVFCRPCVEKYHPLNNQSKSHVRRSK